jgi:hypothetical protein
MNDPITLHDLLVLFGGASIGLVLSVPSFLLFLKWMNHRDMYSFEREMRKRRKKEKKR